MFAYTQTIVCLQGNNYLAIGKYAKKVRTVPRNIILRSLKDALWEEEMSLL
jgi:hypothetical protein